ncbi:hypothetical protein ACH4NI_35365 [Streptomyces olivaceus]|uniref:hypothetical protein n=1 Tax=Streptomyces olivaceus TaxID=47716 RepID=UPI0037A184FE
MSQYLDLSNLPIPVLAFALTAVIATFALPAYVLRVLITKVRPEDLPASLSALSSVLEALALFVPWSRRRGR